MKNRADDIRRRHEERKKQHRKSVGSKGNLVAYQEIGEREDHLSVFHPNSSGNPDHSGHHFARKQWIVFRLMLAVVLFLAVGVMFKSPAYVLDGARGFVNDTFDKEFQFAKIGDWYEKQFGEPLALIPSSKDDKGVKVDQKQPSGYAEPVSGTVKKSFDDTEKGILLQTGNKEGVKAVQEGIVVFVGKEDGLGKVVKVEHSDGTESWYGKLADVDIKLYDFIKQGEKIGKVTPSSDNKDNGTFYFALKKGDAFINPIKVISFD